MPYVTFENPGEIDAAAIRYFGKSAMTNDAVRPEPKPEPKSVPKRKISLTKTAADDF